MKKFSISIPTPCHEDWNAMTSEGKGRFCGSCQKTVVDFSMMSDRQIAEFFKKPATTTCGRFMPDQLGRVIEQPPKRLPWLRYILTIAIPAFLMSCKLGARQATQGKMISTEQHITGDSIAVPLPPPTVGMIIEQPIDTAKAKTSRAKQTKPTLIKRCTIQPVINDSEGFSKAPFVFHPDIFRIDTISPLSLTSQSLSGVLGGFSVTGVRLTKKKAPVPLIPQLTPTKPSSFLIHPNPVQASSSFTIEWKMIDKGIYQLALQNSAGQQVQSEEIIIDNENARATVPLKSTVAGLYFVRLTNKKTGKQFTQNLIVK